MLRKIDCVMVPVGALDEAAGCSTRVSGAVWADPYGNLVCLLEPTRGRKG